MARVTEVQRDAGAAAGAGARGAARASIDSDREVMLIWFAPEPPCGARGDRRGELARGRARKPAEGSGGDTEPSAPRTALGGDASRAR